MGDCMDKRDFFEMVADIYGAPTVGQRLMIEFNDEGDRLHRGLSEIINQYSENDEEFLHDGIRCGMYYSQYIKLAVYLEWKHNITSNKDIRTRHVYELLEYLRCRGFKDSTLKGYITAVRQVCRDNQHLFSEDFELPTNAGYDQYKHNKKEHG